MATSDKYDRQLRLWGASGQRALAETTVILVRATAAGTETLKNLVLPGVGAYCVVDDVASVSPQDVATNFFTSSATASEGEDDNTNGSSSNSNNNSRAKVACEQLQELNPDVQGSFLHVDNLADCVASAQSWHDHVLSKLPKSNGIANDANDTSILVVASDLEPPLKLPLANICQAAGTNLILVQSYGLFGTVRLQTPPIVVLNPKPRSAPADLRLTTPFEALSNWAQGMDWPSLEKDQKAHKHVPYPAILWRIQRDYRAAHQGQLPKTFQEKQAFVQQIKDAALNYGEEDNFQEAVQNAYLAYAERSVNVDHVQEILTKAQTAGHVPRICLYLQALLEFVQDHQGQPPLQGTIPDMTASTDLYVQLQTLYRQQAEQDLVSMTTIVQRLMDEKNKTLDSSAAASKLELHADELQTFCQNVHFLDWVPSRSYQDEMQQSSIPDDVTDDLVMALQEAADDRPEMVPLLWHLGLHACDAFFSAHGRYPGTNNNDDAAWQDDVALLHPLLQTTLERYGVKEAAPSAFTDTETKAAATELCRQGNAELHNIAAICGGVASQEAVKLITGQYTPLHHTYVFNGIAATGGVYRF